MLSLTGIETAAARVVGRIVTRRTSKALETWHLVASLYDTRPAMPTATADALLASLSSTETAGLGHYLESPEIEQQALQLLVTARSGSRRWADNVQVAVRGEVRESLRLSGITPDNLLPVTDLVLDALRVACHEGAVSDLAEPRFLATASHVAATATRNGRLLSRLGTLTAVHELADRMRGQVAALHAEMRLPHTGASRSVPWSELYVEPVLEPGHRQEPAELTEPGRRTVILGDPGAGKSTLVHKLAYDTALLPGGPAPFLLTLRDLPDITVRKARLADHLRELWREPYNLEPSPEDVEYLLLNGRAVVILDGLDELTDIARRRRVTQLVEAFVALFPLVPMIVTSRRIGYHEVPLSDRLFHTRTIEPFNDERVESYATHWFRLDDATPPAQRDRLRDLFLAETVAIDDLRSNPLLLALLCAMYATEQYIPRNRAQVYEKCALMVFDRWDSMRGIPLAVQFQGHVRGAVQELAWQMFAVSDVSELPRYKVLRIITRYLVAKGFDDADSERLAEKFLGFCAGRAWVLAEVGATETEPVYGFAHRTFLEYFTAEHLVRHHPEPGSLWEVLADKLDSGTWEVVAQLAVQLLERNRDNGATELLDHPLKLLEASGTTMDLNLAGFVARATGEVSLPPTTLDRIVAVALSAMRAVRIKDRVTLESDGPVADPLVASDGPMLTLMADSLDGNVHYLVRSVRDQLGTLIEAGDGIGLYLLAIALDWTFRDKGVRRADRWRRLGQELEKEHARELARWFEAEPWSAPQPPDPETVERYGPGSLYLRGWILNASYPPHVLAVLSSGRGNAIRQRLMGEKTPWRLPQTLRSTSGTAERMLGYFGARGWPEAGPELATFLVLALPYLETIAKEKASLGEIESKRALELIDIRRKSGQGSQGVRAPARAGMPDDAWAFLRDWAFGRFSVLPDQVS